MIGRVKQSQFILATDGSYKTPRLGAFLYPVLRSRDSWRNALTLGVNEWTVGMDALAMSLKVVKAGEAALAARMRAYVRFGPSRAVRLSVGLINVSIVHCHEQKKHTFRLKARANPRPHV